MDPSWKKQVLKDVQTQLATIAKMPRGGSWEYVLGFGMATKACCSLQMVFSGWVYISSWQHYDGTVPLLYSSLFQICPVLSRSDSSQSTTTASKELWRNLAGHPFFNRDRIRERLRSYHKPLTTWQYPPRTSLSCVCSRLTGTWISGLLVKALGMIWATQMLCTWTVPFLPLTWAK